MVGKAVASEKASILRLPTSLYFCFWISYYWSQINGFAVS